MRHFMLSTIALAALTGSALAADLPSTKAPPVYVPPAPIFSLKAKPKPKTVKCKKGSVKQHGKCVKRKANKRAKRAKRSSRRGK